MFKKLLILLLALTASSGAGAQYVISTAVPMTYNGGGGGGGSTVPAVAQAAGYVNNTFSSPSFSSSNVDVQGTCNSNFSSCSNAFQWYLCNFNSATPVAVSSASTATGGSNTTLVDTSGVGNANQYVGFVLYNKTRGWHTAITSNTTTTLTFASQSPSAASGDAYFISDLSFPGDGTIKVLGQAANAEICMAMINGSISNFHGTALGVGDYIEIVMEQPNIGSFGDTGSWPALWLQTLEGSLIFNANCTEAGYDTTNPCAHWAGQASGFRHQIEDDWMENGVDGASQMSSALHESFGVYNVTCTSPHKFCQYDTHMPKWQQGTALTANLQTSYHKYGRIWVPATSGSNGYVAYFFDDVEQSRTTWSQFRQNSTNTSLSPYLPTNLPNYCGGTNSTSCGSNGSSGPGAGSPGTPAWAFGIKDLMHEVMMIGTSANAPIQVKSVNVWQSASTGLNLTN